jgi:death-on-curing protein
MEITCLTAAEIVALHQHMMRKMGWHPAPLRSEDLLESAVQRAQAAVYYGGAGLVEQASVLAIGISQNQPFLDGNRRTALYSLIAFLRLNGHDFAGDPLDLARQLIVVAERTDSLEEATARFAAWVRERTIAKDPE